MNIKAKLIDCFYENDSLFVTVKHTQKQTFRVLFFPYFYLSFNQLLTSQEQETIKTSLSAKEVVKTSKKNITNIYKITFNKVSSLVSAKEKLDEQKILPKNYSVHEYDIPFIHRFFLDNQLTNFIDVSLTIENNIVTKISPVNRKIDVSNLEIGCFDIEVLVSEDLSFPDPKQQPIVSISYVDNNNNRYCFLQTSNKPLTSIKETLEKQLNVFAFVFSSEKEMLLGFINFLEKKDPDILYTYNGIFDIDYLHVSYQRLFDQELKIKNHSITFNKYPRKRAVLSEIVHIDVYQLLKTLRYFQAVNYSKLDLNSVYTNITNKQKVVLSPQEIRDKFLNQDYLELIKYNLDDVCATLEIAKLYMDFIYGICSFVNAPIDDVLFFSASAIVEKLFIKEYINLNKIIPNKPTKYQMAIRRKHSFPGGFVYRPQAGLYENIAVVDFRTYHVSLLIAYNISPETINAKDDYIEVNNIKISKQPTGFVPNLLKSLIDYRSSLKKQMIEYDKKSIEYLSMYRRQFATKTLIASIYGYMGFAGARWYCFECLDAMYFLVRQKIQDLINVFKEKKYSVIYGDTDSCFVLFKDIKKLKEDIQEINNKSSERIVLELEDVFKTGLFVKSRDETKTAKKKYALLDFNNDLKITGFEFVRRDWCRLAKDVQKKVLGLVLEKKDASEAIVYVKKKIEDLKQKKVVLQDLVIQSFVRKNLSKYKTKNPAQSAVISAKQQGYNFSSSNVVEFVITNKGKTISEKAKIIDFVKDNDYDVDYYLEKQLIPSVFSILNVFGVTKEELISNTKQKDLKDFFK